MLRKLSLFLAVVFVIAMVSTTGSAMQDREVSDECINRIYDFFTCIDENDWNNYPSFYAPEVRERQEAFVSNVDYVNDGVGILAISSIKVLDVVRIVDDTSYRFYPELAEFYESPSTYRCYEVYVKETTVTSDYYPNGNAKHLVIMVFKNGEWWIGQTTILVDSNTRDAYGFYNFSPRPTSIVMMDENGTKSTVPFYDYLFNVTCNEIGNMSSFSTDSFKANAMSVKMLGWWAAYKHPYSNLGCDLVYGFVAFKSVNDAGTTGRTRVASAIRNTCKYYTVSSSGTGGKLFSTNYTQGSYNSSGQSGGQLSQYGSDYLSDTYGYGWQDIIHYYYDNSSHNSPNVGTVQIISSSHTYSGYQSNAAQHWRVCTFCGYETTHTAHTLVDHGAYLQCSVCGRKIYVN